MFTFAPTAEAVGFHATADEMFANYSTHSSRGWIGGPASEMKTAEDAKDAEALLLHTQALRPLRPPRPLRFSFVVGVAAVRAVV